MAGAGTSTGETPSSSTRRTGAATSRQKNTRLKSVKVDTWGGWVWINMDPDSEPLQQYLEPASTMLGPFGTGQKMPLPVAPMACTSRCNWEDGAGGVQRELPRLRRRTPNSTGGEELVSWSRAEPWGTARLARPCRHSTRPAAKHRRSERRSRRHRRGRPRLLGGDAGLSDGGDQHDDHGHLHPSRETTGRRSCRPARPMRRVSAHLVASAKRDDAAPRRHLAGDRRGPPGRRRDRLARFPEQHHPAGRHLRSLLPRGGPNGPDPDSCIFEVYALERFPEGQEPKTEWVFRARSDRGEVAAGPEPGLSRTCPTSSAA